MLVKFTTNVGSNDAASFGLDFSKCCEGMTLEVTDAIGERLIVRRLAVQAEIRAVPPAAAIAAVPLEGSVEKATEDLKAYKAKASHQTTSHRKE